MTQETKSKIKLQNQYKIKDDEERNVGEWSKHLDDLMDIYNKEQNSVDKILKLVGQRQEQHELCIQKTISTITNHLTKDITQENDLLDIFLTKHETNILKLGVSVTPTPKYNISELKTDIYNFIRKL